VGGDEDDITADLEAAWDNPEPADQVVDVEQNVADVEQNVVEAEEPVPAIEAPEH
jgi:hypothetical protein